MNLRAALLGLLAITILTPRAEFFSAQNPGTPGGDSLEETAFNVGLQAYIYGFPLVITEVSREEMLANPSIRVNQFYHFPGLATPVIKSAVSANVDTLMSIAWLDFSNGPLLLNVPAMHGRYWVVQFNDFYTNSFAYVGLRTTGSDEQYYLLAGPDWTDTGEVGMKVIRCPTNVVFVVGRVFTAGERDLAEAQELQHEISLTSFGPAASLNPRGADVLPESLRADFAAELTPPEIVAKMDAPAFFAAMTRLMQLYPPPPEDEPAVKEFARVGIDLNPGFDPKRLDAATLRGLVRAADAAIPYIVAAQPKVGGRTVNGWWTPPDAGEFGTNYLLRAYMALNFIWPNVAAEAVYPMTSVDGSGRPLDGAHRYVLHFAKGATMPVGAFWSVTMFNTKRALVENPIHRYAIGSRTEGLKYNPDGSLDIFIQADPPRGHESNWLPAPAEGFLLTMRLYIPKPPILNGTYAIPPVQCTDCKN
jgi:hypothetical protein